MLTTIAAQKYKDYNKARDILSGKVPLHKIAPPKQHQTPRKRKREEEPSLPVTKQVHTLKTPSKPFLNPWEVDPYESPNVVRSLFTPSKKIAIGPTPQKDGQVLGLFDLLGKTPEKIENLSENRVSIMATPRKPSQLNPTSKHSKTPSTASKRRMLDMFGTPRKSLKLDGKGGNTPSSISKLHFSTPSFLRRDSQRIKILPANEENESLELSPQMTRIPRKPLVRSLSTMLAGLRQIQEDALDDELEALHEMEASNSISISAPAKKPTLAPAPKLIVTAPEDILVEDSQPGFPLGGFDSEGANDSEPEEMKNPTLGRDGLPLKVYKKKGQKRTTRAVKMKPTRSKPTLAPSPITEESEDELCAVPETELRDDCGGGDENRVEERTVEFDDARNFDSDSQSEYTASEGGTRYRRPDQNKKRKVMTKEGKIRAVGRKVTSLASQNFKRLKLRNSGAKGGAAHNSRFRRKK